MSEPPQTAAPGRPAPDAGDQIVPPAERQDRRPIAAYEVSPDAVL